MKINGYTAAVTGALFGAICASTGVSAETWKFASKMPTDSPEGKVFQYFADEVAKNTGGKLKVRIFPSEQLGKSAAALEQLQKGTIQIYAEGSVWMRKWSKDIETINTRFVFKDRAAWVRFAKSPMVQKWYADAEKKSGVKVLGDLTGILRGPYRVVVSKEPINQMSDFNGLKIRQSKAKMGALAYGTLGAEVRALSWTGTYQSMKTGIVAAVTSPAALVESMKFYEVAPNITRLDEFYQSIALMMNGASWNKLSKESKDALLKAHAAASKRSHEVMDGATEKAFARMKKNGVKFGKLDVAPFVKKLRPVYQELEAKGDLPKGFLAAVDKANGS